MGFYDSKVYRIRKSTFSVIATASDCTEYTESSRREQICTSGCSLAGLLGNLSLGSYFIKKKESEAVIVQTSGVISTYIVMLQLAMGEAMPLPQFIAVTIVVASGLVLNFMKYFDFLNSEMWRFWEDFITVFGLSTLPRVKKYKYVMQGQIKPQGSCGRLSSLMSRILSCLGLLPLLVQCLLFLWVAWESSLIKGLSFLDRYLGGRLLFFSCGWRSHKCGQIF